MSASMPLDTLNRLNGLPASPGRDHHMAIPPFAKDSSHFDPVTPEYSDDIVWLAREADEAFKDVNLSLTPAPRGRTSPPTRPISRLASKRQSKTAVTRHTSVLNANAKRKKASKVRVKFLKARMPLAYCQSSNSAVARWKRNEMSGGMAELFHGRIWGGRLEADEMLKPNHLLTGTDEPHDLKAKKSKDSSSASAKSLEVDDLAVRLKETRLALGTEDSSSTSPAASAGPEKNGQGMKMRVGLNTRIENKLRSSPSELSAADKVRSLQSDEPEPPAASPRWPSPCSVTGGTGLVPISETSPMTTKGKSPLKNAISFSPISPSSTTSPSPLRNAVPFSPISPSSTASPLGSALPFSPISPSSMANPGSPLRNAVSFSPISPSSTANPSSPLRNAVSFSPISPSSTASPGTERRNTAASSQRTLRQSHRSETQEKPHAKKPQLESTPYSKTSPLFRHGTIRVQKRQKQPDVPDWTAFQMAISGGAGDYLMEGGDILSGVVEVEAEVNDLLEWWNGFGFSGEDGGCGALVRSSANEKRRDRKGATNEKTPTRRRARPLLSIAELDSRPARPRQGETESAEKQDCGYDSDQSLPDSPMCEIDPAKISDDKPVVPMGPNIAHDLTDFLKWEARHVEGLD